MSERDRENGWMNDDSEREREREIDRVRVIFWINQWMNDDGEYER